MTRPQHTHSPLPEQTRSPLTQQPLGLPRPSSRVAGLTRGTVAAALVIGPALMIVSYIFMPDFSGAMAESLTAIADQGPTATLSAFCFILFQLFLPIGLLGVVTLTRTRVPVLSTIALVLVGLGAFGHAVYGGVQLTMLSMAQDLTALDTHVAVLERGESGVGLALMAVGLLGTVVGFILLGVTVWRAGLGPRWLGPALILWVVVEFAGSGFSEWAGYASGLLFATLFGTLAAVVWRSSLTHWMTAAEAELPVPASAQA